MLRVPTFFAAFLIVCGVALAAYGVGGFSHDNTDEVFGYYSPKTEIKVGHFRLDTLSIGTIDDLTKYESGAERLKTYAPVMFVFQDVTSKQLKTENGDTYYENEPRVLPMTYRIHGNSIMFTGTDPQVGTVSFTGTIDIALLKSLVAEGTLYTTKPIVTGTLAIRGKVYKDVGFTWFGGD